MPGRPVACEQRSSAARMPRSSGTSSGSVAVDRRPAPSRSTSVADRVAPDERAPAPALAVLHRLEQEARAVADELGEGRDRRLQVGQQLAPHRHDRVLARPARGTPRGSAGCASTAQLAEAAEEAASARRCGRRPCPPARPRTAACRRRSRSTPRARTGGRREVSPLRHTSWRLRLQKTVRPSSSVSRSVSAFIHAIISTWPVPSLLDDGRHEPVGVVLARRRAARRWRRSACRWAWRDRTGTAVAHR